MFRVDTSVKTGAGRNIGRRQIDAIARRKANEAGREMVRVANDRMASDFNLDRPHDRRRHPGSGRAKNALDYQVDKTTTPITIRFRVKGGDDVLARIIFMNYGTVDHDIWPSGKWPLSRSALPEFLVWPSKDGSKLVKMPAVWHPGQDGKDFLQDGRDVAVQMITD